MDLEQLAVVGEFLADVIDKVGEAGIGQVHHVLRPGFPVRRDQSVFRIEGVNGEFRQDGPVSGGAQAVNVDVNGWIRSVDADGAVFRLQGGPGVVRAIGQRFRIDGEIQGSSGGQSGRHAAVVAGQHELNGPLVGIAAQVQFAVGGDGK